MIIVLEGSDCSGKSTVAHNLAQVFCHPQNEVTKMHFGQPDMEVDPVTTYVNPVESWLGKTHRQPNDVLIIDRYHIGELVYGPILRDGNRMTTAEKETIDQFLLDINAVKFHVRPAVEIVIDRMEQRGEKLLTPRQVLTAYYHFDQLIGQEESGWGRCDETVQRVLQAMGILSHGRINK